MFHLIHKPFSANLPAFSLPVNLPQRSDVFVVIYHTEVQPKCLKVEGPVLPVSGTSAAICHHSPTCAEHSGPSVSRCQVGAFRPTCAADVLL